MTENEHPDPSRASALRARSIRSFVTRSGRVTDAQERALQLLWPKYGIEFGAAPLDLPATFGRAAHRIVEIGFGNGENLTALAAAYPERDFLGIEVHRSGVGRVLLAAEEHQLGNLRVICHDAVEVLELQIPLQSLDEVLILFPDPWPKKRHHKRRLVQGPFVELLAGRMNPAGVLRLATDWQPYAEHMLEVLSACPLLNNQSAQGSFVPRPPERAPTRFEKRGERLGHGVWDLAFRRI
jgi:tRNA (guanine-N7-)-methyltransferase